MNAAAQDQQGDLWFATDAGACRYDGASFTTYGVEDGLPGTEVRDVLVDRRGAIWFAILRGAPGVSRLEGGQMTTYAFPDSTGIQYVICLLEDHEGSLWIGTIGGGLLRYRDGGFTQFTTRDGLPTDDVFQKMSVDAQGGLWFPANDADEVFEARGVVRYDGQSFTLFDEQDGLPFNRVMVVLAARDGTVWFGYDSDGVVRFDGEHMIVIDPDVVRSAKAIRQDSRGNIWFPGWEGVVRYDGARFTRFTEQDGLGHRIVADFLEDREGNLWFTTGYEAEGGGVSRYDGEHVVRVTGDGGLPEGPVLAVVEDGQSRIWAGTEDGVSRWHGERWESFPLTNRRHDLDRVEVLLADRAGDLWIGGGGRRGYIPGDLGLIRYDGREFATLTTADGLPNGWVSALLEDRQGHLWVGTGEGPPGHGLVHYVDGEFTAPPFIEAEKGYIRAILEDRQGRLWLGTDEGALRYDGDTVTRFTRQGGLAHDQVFALCEDRLGNIWFGTAGGASRWDGASFVSYTTFDGLAGDNVQSIAVDDRGNLLFGTLGGGMSQFDGLVFQNLRTRDGLTDNGVRQVIQDSRRDIWIATDGGLTRYRRHRRPGVRPAHRIGPLQRARLPVDPLPRPELPDGAGRVGLRLSSGGRRRRLAVDPVRSCRLRRSAGG